MVKMLRNKKNTNKCEVCDNKLKQTSTSGRVKKYCSAACRSKHFRDKTKEFTEIGRNLTNTYVQNNKPISTITKSDTESVYHNLKLSEENQSVPELEPTEGTPKFFLKYKCWKYSEIEKAT